MHTLRRKRRSVLLEYYFLWPTFYELVFFIKVYQKNVDEQVYCIICIVNKSYLKPIIALILLSNNTNYSAIFYVLNFFGFYYLRLESG